MSDIDTVFKEVTQRQEAILQGASFMEAVQRQDAAIKQRKEKVRSAIDHYSKEHQNINDEVAILLPHLIGVHGSNAQMLVESRILALFNRNNPLCLHSRIAMWETNLVILYFRGCISPDEDLMAGRRLLRPSDIKAKVAADDNPWGCRLTQSKFSTPIPIRIAKN